MGFVWVGLHRWTFSGTEQRMGAVSSQSTLYNEKRSCMVVDQHLHIGVLSGSFASFPAPAENRPLPGHGCEKEARTLHAY
jgi:hypothetical protein